MNKIPFRISKGLLSNLKKSNNIYRLFCTTGNNNKGASNFKTTLSLNEHSDSLKYKDTLDIKLNKAEEKVEFTGKNFQYTSTVKQAY